MNRDTCGKCGGRLVLAGLDRFSAIAVCRRCHAEDRPDVDRLFRDAKKQVDRLASFQSEGATR